MDSLKIQDVFEPYYCGRNGVAARRDKRLLAKSENSLASERIALPTNIRLSDNKPDATTEH